MDERKRRSKEQEKRVAKELNGKTQPASGALWAAKADVRSDLFLVECKTTLKDSYRLTFNTWNKVYNEALKDGMRVPVMCIELEGGRTKLAVMRTDDLNGYISYVINTAKVPSYLLNSSIGNSLRGLTFTLHDKKTGKEFLLQAFPWNKFLEQVVTSYK